MWVFYTLPPVLVIIGFVVWRMVRPAKAPQRKPGRSDSFFALIEKVRAGILLPWRPPKMKAPATSAVPTEKGILRSLNPFGRDAGSRDLVLARNYGQHKILYAG